MPSPLLGDDAGHDATPLHGTYWRHLANTNATDRSRGEAQNSGTTADIVVTDHCSGPGGTIGPVRRVCVCVCLYKLLLPTTVVVRVVQSVRSVVCVK